MGLLRDFKGGYDLIRSGKLAVMSSPLRMHQLVKELKELRLMVPEDPPVVWRIH